VTTYRYIVADLVTDVERADIQLADAEYGPSLNGGGTLTGLVPLQYGLTLDDLAPGRTSIYAYRDNALMWGGIVWGLDPAGSDMRLMAAGFESYADRRILKQTFGPYAFQDRLSVAADIWRHIQQEISIGVEVPAEYLTSVAPKLVYDALRAVEDTARLDWEKARDELAADPPVGDAALVAAKKTAYDAASAAARVAYDAYFATITGPTNLGTYDDPVEYPWWETHNCGDVIRDLAGNDAGFDYRIDVVQEGAGRRKILRLGYPRLGNRLVDFVVASGSNVRATPSLTIDGTFLSNSVIGIGAGEGQDTLRCDQFVAPGPYPWLDASVQMKYEVNYGFLEGRTKAELAARGSGAHVPNVFIGTAHPDMPFGAYQPGDDVWVDVHDGWATFAGWCRIMGWTLRPESEEVRLDLARSDLFMYGPGPDLT
jgi:hypothetical protein